MNDDLITTTYNNIVKPSLAPIFEYFQSKDVRIVYPGIKFAKIFPNFQPKFEQFLTLFKASETNFDTLIPHPVLTCYHLQFVVLYRTFIEPQELLDIAKFSSYVLLHNNKTLRQMTLKSLF
jgi:hypothetical protein